MTTFHSHRLRLALRRSDSSFGRTPTSLEMRVPSSVDCIEEAVDVLVRHCLAGGPTAPETRFKLQVVLSEALANAVLRGNREADGTFVHVEADLLPDSIRIRITDEGDGFDPASIPDSVGGHAVEATGGRGLFLIRHLVDAVQFNERGNSICMTLRRH